nr:uncharacterized protein LOC115256716 [Aedes albopictus]
MGLVGGSSYGDEMHEDSASDQVLLLEKDALKLRRELQDALASKQESENRITALESIVSTLKEQVPPAVTSSGSGTQQSLTGVKGTTTTMTTMNATSALNPVGMVGASGHHQHHHPHQQQQQHQPNHHHQYYFRSINNGSPSQQQPRRQLVPYRRPSSKRRHRFRVTLAIRQAVHASTARVIRRYHQCFRSGNGSVG